MISVGNLTVGGTGKTPLVEHLCLHLARRGAHPCVAMRGYAAGAGVSSDEADAFRRAFARAGVAVPVVAQSDRGAGVRALLRGGTNVGVVVLDDGFQHHRLRRDLDIVLVDATRPPLADRLLPAGWLREPPGALTRAGAVIVTHAEGVSGPALSELERALESFHGRPVAAVTRHEWTGLDVSGVTEPGSSGAHPVEWLRGKRVLVVCAIGNPGAFLRAAALAIGSDPAATMVLRDHHPYDGPTRRRLIAAVAGMEAILTTDKDWSKLGAHAASLGCPVARPRLRLAFDRGEDTLLAMAERAARVAPVA